MGHKFGLRKKLAKANTKTFIIVNYIVGNRRPAVITTGLSSSLILVIYINLVLIKLLNQKKLKGKPKTLLTLNEEMSKIAPQPTLPSICKFNIAGAHIFSYGTHTKYTLRATLHAA